MRQDLLALSIFGLGDERANGVRKAENQRPEKASFFRAIVLLPAIAVNKWIR
jgi:hypothetical protein